MAQNYPEEMLPSYQDVVREQQRNQPVCRLTGKTVLVINIIISIITVCGLFSIRYIDNFMVRPINNVTEYCNDAKYNFHPISTSTYFAAQVAIGTMFAVCLVLALITCKRNECTWRQLLKTIVRTIWITGMHLIFMLTLIDILKCVTGVPSPYFFSHEKIKNFYCLNKKNVEDVLVSFIALDNSLRKSFPSRRSAIYAFCTTVTYIFIDHFDNKRGLQAIQQLVALLMGLWLFYHQYVSWKHRENHFGDILVGAGIGIIYAMITIRNTFGSVFNFRVRTLPCFKEIPFENFPSAPPINFEGYECTHPLTTVRYESCAAPVIVDNTNEDAVNREANNADNIETAEIHNAEEVNEAIAETQL